MESRRSGTLEEVGMTKDKVGPEDLLVEELRAVVQGKRPTTEEWKIDHGAAAYMNGTGSGNWKPVEAAVRYAIEPESIRPWLIGVFFPLMRDKFMNTELMSLIYGAMHLGAWLSIARTAEALGDAAILREARACVRLYLWILAQRQCPDGRVLVAGCRSAGHAAWEHGDPWGRYALALATGNGRESAFAGLKAAGEGPAKAWGMAVFGACFDQLSIAGSVLPGVGFRAATDLHVVRCSEGVATWVGRNVNSNTKPEMLSIWQRGKITTIPGPELGAQGGQRVNRGWMEATCRYLDGELKGSRDGVPFSLRLPGAILSHIELPGPSDGVIEHPADPPPATPPPAGIDIEALVAEVLALGAQDSDAGFVIAQIRTQSWLNASRMASQLAVPKRLASAKWALSDRFAKMAQGEQ